jgi:hypothetical protein
MLAWRRMKIADIGADAFRQDFPSTPEEAVQGSKGLIFPMMRQCIIDKLPFDATRLPASEKVGGIDPGYNDPCVILSGFFKDQVLYIVDVWRQTETLAQDQVDALHPGHHYFVDPSELTERLNLERQCSERKISCRFSPAPRRKNPGEDCESQELRKILRMIEKGKLKILRSASKQLILEADNLMWDEKTAKPKMDRGPIWGHFDTLMGLKYMVMGVEVVQCLSSLKAPDKKESRASQWSKV